MTLVAHPTPTRERIANPTPEQETDSGESWIGQARGRIGPQEVEEGISIVV